MKIKELQDKTDVELKKMLGELREELRMMRFKAGQLSDSSQVKKTRRTVARILTILNTRAEA